VTGEWRSKKTITSHLQVLKPWIDGLNSPVIDSLALSCLTKDTGGKSIPSSFAKRSWHEIIQELLMEAGYYSGKQDLLRNLVLNSPYHKASSRRTPQICEKVGILIPDAYEMTLTSNNSTLPSPLYQFAVNIKDPEHEYMGLRDWAMFVQRYPELGALQQKRPLNCDVALVHSAIGRPQTDQTAYGLSVSGKLRCGSEALPAGTELTTVTTIYHARVPIRTIESRGKTRVSEDYGCEIDIASWDRGHRPEFVSLQAAVIGKGDKSRYEDGLSEVSNYTMTQEIDTITNGQRTRVLVVHHKFDAWRPLESKRAGQPVYKYEGETRWQQMHISDRLQDDNNDADFSFDQPEPELATTQLDTSWVDANGIRVGCDSQTPASAPRTTSGSWTTPSSASGDVINKDLLFSTPTSSSGGSGISGIDSWLDPQLQDHSIATLPDTIHPFDLSTPIGSGMMMGQHRQFAYPSQGLDAFDMYGFDPSQQQQQQQHQTPSRAPNMDFLGDFGQ
jgi:hypothetical protein